MTRTVDASDTASTASECGTPTGEPVAGSTNGKPDRAIAIVAMYAALHSRCSVYPTLRRLLADLLLADGTHIGAVTDQAEELIDAARREMTGQPACDGIRIGVYAEEEYLMERGQ